MTAFDLLTALGVIVLPFIAFVAFYVLAQARRFNAKYGDWTRPTDLTE